VLAELAITIVLDGHALEGSRSATLRNGVVVAPLDPYVRRFADEIDTGNADGQIVISRAGVRIVVAIGSPLAQCGSAIQRLPIAPFVREGEPNIPLAATARALGASVRYEPSARAIYVDFEHRPIATMTPFAGYVAPTDPVTFAPTATPAPPAPASTGSPRPRRTPIVVRTSR
jgi:hypothetical protein